MNTIEKIRQEQASQDQSLAERGQSPIEVGVTCAISSQVDQSEETQADYGREGRGTHGQRHIEFPEERLAERGDLFE